MTTILRFFGALAILPLLSISIAAHAAAAPFVSACPPAADGRADCATVIAKDAGQKAPFDTPVGLTPAQLLKAYNLPGTAAATSTPIIAVVSAFDAPTIAADLRHYSEVMGIPSLAACKGDIRESPVPCFKKVDQRGGHDFASSTAWAAGTSLKVESAHAICQNCSILLVEADDNWSTNDFAAIVEATELGAQYVDIGFDVHTTESKSLYDQWDPIFDHPDVAFVAPEGEGGYGYYSYPAASKLVTAVGGTTLKLKSDGSYDSETAWAPSASFCAGMEKKPSWEADPKCRKRMGADVAMVGDTGTGFAMYDSTPNGSGATGWFLAGGTSLSASLVTAVYALAGDHAATSMSELPYERYSADAFHDVRAGTNGDCKGKGMAAYFCNAGKGYDGPSGLGSPNGISGF